MTPRATRLAQTAGVVLGLLAAPRPGAQRPAAAPADVSSIDAIVRASSDVMNGPAGQPRQWRRDSTFYMPAATFVAVREVAGRVEASVLTPEEYRRSSFPRFEREGGYETEIGRHIERFGNVAQVRSVAVSRQTADRPVRARYVNYFQLYRDGSRWWIAGMVRDAETPTRPIPATWIGKWEGAHAEASGKRAHAEAPPEVPLPAAAAWGQR